MGENLKPTFSGEVMLAGWRESHNAGATVTFWLPDESELDVFRALTVRKGNTAGQRFMAVLVEIGDDELPVGGNETPAAAPIGGTLARSAGMVCASEGFWRYVEAQTRIAYATPSEREAQATEFLRCACRIETRATLDHDQDAKTRFVALMRAFNDHTKKVAA